MVQPFYIDTTGAAVLGDNQTYGAGSQLQAGFRAKTMDSPITDALTTFGGRIAAQTMQYMFQGDLDGLLNYVAFRPFAMQHIIETLLEDPNEAAGMRILDPAGGYSPVFYWLAKKYAETAFIEIDIPKVIENKRRMLHPFGIPQNLRLRSTALSEHYLHSVLTDHCDVILALGAYVTQARYRELLDYLPQVLNTDGKIIAAFPYLPGIDNFQQNSMIFSKIVTQPVGALANERAIHTLFKDTPFEIVNIICLSELAAKMDAPMPADIEIIAVAQLRS